MQDHSKSSRPETVRCDVCLKEIPASDAQSAEVQDYVVYFCGIDCYDQWKKRAASPAGSEKRTR